MSWFSEYYTSSDIDSATIEKFKHFLVKEDEDVNLLEEEFTKSVEKINSLSENTDIPSTIPPSANSISLAIPPVGK